MASVEVKNFDQPDETKPTADRGRIEIVELAGAAVGRMVLEPGWRWSEHVKPSAGTDSCQATHMGYAITGRLHVRMDDGSEREIRPGDAYVIPPGHDAWVVGEQTVVHVDFQGARAIAKALG